MKTLYILILSLGISLLGKSQTPCSAFCVTDISITVSKGYTMHVTILFTGESGDFINYPYVSAVVVGNDTIAEGWMDFFGQIGNTEQVYSFSTELAEIPENFECVVHFRYDKTGCELAYPCATASMQNETVKPSIVCYPNPANDFIVIDKGNASASSVELLDAVGKSIARYTLPKQQVRIEVAQLPTGTYFLQFMDSNGKAVQTERVTVRF